MPSEVEGKVHVQIVEDQKGVKAWLHEETGAGKLPDFKIKCASSTTIHEVLASIRLRSNEQTQKSVQASAPGSFFMVDLVRLQFEGEALSKTSTLEQSGISDGAQMSAVNMVAYGNASPCCGMCVPCIAPDGAWVKGITTAYKRGGTTVTPASEEMARS